MPWSRRSAVLVAFASLSTLVACRGGGDGAAVTSAAAGSVNAYADEPGGDRPAQTASSIDAGGTQEAASTTSDVDDGGVAGEGRPADYHAAPFDPPIGEPDLTLLAFDDRGAYRWQSGVARQVLDGPVSELADDSEGGVIFQRPDDSQTIWWQPAGATLPLDALVTAEPGASLVLEGVTGEGDGRQIVYQKQENFGGPQEVTASLRLYALADGRVSELATTGGWEHSTSIGPVIGSTAVGVWDSEAWRGLFWFDLRERESLVPDLGHDEIAFAGDGFPDLVAANGEHLVAVAHLGSEAVGVVDQIGLVSVDETGQVLDVLAAFPWDNGYWYAIDLMVIDGHAVISRSDQPMNSESEGSPMGAIVVDLSTGEAMTLPFAAQVRPALS